MQSFARWLGMGSIALASPLLILLVPAANAEPCIGPESTATPTYCRLVSTTGSSLTVTGGGHTINLDDIVIVLDPGPPTFDSFFDIFVQIDLQPFQLMHGFGVWFSSPQPADPIPPGQPALPTELLQLDLSAPGLKLRESPTLASTGEVSSQNQGGGQFRIDSFFDVFVELSLDDGSTWIPSTTPVRLALQHKVPEPGTLVLMGLSLLLLTSIRRRP